MEIIFATNNAHKLEEVQAILGEGFKIITLSEYGIIEDIPETGTTLAENATLKTQYVWQRIRQDCFADDTGLEVEVLGGAPGVHSARYATEGHDFEANRVLLLKNMEGEINRKARFRTVISLILDGTEHQFEGIIEGEISLEEMGDNGFGYDSIFIPDGYKNSFAELPAQIKNEISHRGRAVEKLANFLNQITSLA